MCFTVAYLIGIAGVADGRRTDGAAIPVWAIAVVGLFSALYFTFLFWTAFWITRRLPAGKGAERRWWTYHLGAGIVVAPAGTLLNTVVEHTLRLPAESAPLSDMLIRLLMYGLLAGAAHALEFARHSRKKETSELRLRTELIEAELGRARAELQALKLELNPHFLFNALNAASVLVHEDARRAAKLLVNLTDFLRRVLERTGTQMVRLAEEMEFVRAYLLVEQGRLGVSLQVEWKVDDAVLDALVPHLVLQPVVENAIKHGLAPRGGGYLRIRAERGAGALHLEVQNEGGKIHGQALTGLGMGTANVRARLRRLYGVDARFDLCPVPGGMLALIRLPLHAPAGAAAPDPPLAKQSRTPTREVPHPAGTSSHGGGRHQVRRLAFVACFAVLWMLFTDLNLDGAPAAGAPMTLPRAAAGGLYAATLWTFFLWVALRTSRRFPLEAGSWISRLPIHAATGILLGLTVWASQVVNRLLFGYAQPSLGLRQLAQVTLGNLLVYALLVGAAHAVEYTRRYRNKETTELRLRAELTEAELGRARAELQALKLELNPHFLFNALNAASVLAHKDARRTTDLLVALADFLRNALHSSAGGEVVLEDEIASLRLYLEVERGRLGDSLQVEWEVDEEALEAPVPHRTLQTLVENAIASHPEGCIRIRARCDGGALSLEVMDGGTTSGAGAPPLHALAGPHHVYGADARFELGPAPSIGSLMARHLPGNTP